MKNKFFILSFLSISFLFSNIYIFDQDSSELLWRGKKITGDHYGSVDIESGYVEIKNDSLMAAQITINMQSIKVIDIVSEEYNAYLESHLKDPDFFDVETFPVSIFKIDSPQRISMHDWNINGTLLFGDLTIKDISHSTTIPMTLTIQGNKAKATGIIKIDRTLFGIIYGSGTFYDNLADKAIDDEFYIKFNVVGYIQ